MEPLKGANPIHSSALYRDQIFYIVTVREGAGLSARTTATSLIKNSLRGADLYIRVMSGGFERANTQSETFLPFFVSSLESDLYVIEKDYPQRGK